MEPDADVAAPVTTDAVAGESGTFDARDAHAVDRTYAAALRTTFQALLLGISVGRLFTAGGTVTASLLLSLAAVIGVFSAARHHLNSMSVRKGVVRVDGVLPVVIFVVGLAATVSALVQAVGQVRNSR